MAFKRTPVAWLLLVDHPARLILAVLRIAFAVVLMCTQLLFMTSVLDTQCRPIQALAADLFVVSNRQYTIVLDEPFPRRRLYQALDVEGVISAAPLYYEMGNGRLRALASDEPGGVDRQIRVFGMNPHDTVFSDPEIQAHAALLEPMETALFDSSSRLRYGPSRQGGDILRPFHPGDWAELAGRRVQIVGTFHLGPDYAQHGNLLMSDVNFVRYFPERQLGWPSLGLLRLSPGADPHQVARALRRSLPGDVEVFTHAEMLWRETMYFLRRTPTGIVFGFGLLVGFAVGVITCNQILFSDVIENLPQLATLKAIGYTNRFLFRLVAQEGLWLGVLGFCPGLAVSLAATYGLEAITGVVMRLTLGRVLLVGAMTLVMCLLSAVIAVRKAIKADPAEVF